MMKGMQIWQGEVLLAKTGSLQSALENVQTDPNLGI